MAHIAVPEGIPGIVGPMMAYPVTGKALNEIAELLLCKETATLNKAERETIASYVSYLNNCVFCSEIHGAVADVHWKQKGISRQVWAKENWNHLSERLQTLLVIAEKVQKDARTVNTEDIAKAKKFGATEDDIHDTVLIAAAFCMFNRYVDGLGTMAPPRKDAFYEDRGYGLTVTGYRNAIPPSK